VKERGIKGVRLQINTIETLDKVAEVGYTGNTNEEIGDVNRLTW
jgi:hypothetical protein